jgi:hypothetical protein
MKKLRIYLLVLLVCPIGFSQAQQGSTQSAIDPNSFGYYQDALRFGSMDRGGSARIQGLAGSGVALGGDISSVIINPAGLGFFNKSEMSISPQMSFRNNSGQYQGSEISTFNNKFSVGQIGVSIDLTKSDYEKSDFKGGSLAFTYNKRNDFNVSQELVGDNYQSSIVDFYLESAQGTFSNNFYNNEGSVISPVGMAYDAFLFDIDIANCTDPNCSQYERFYAFEPMRQREITRTWGNQNEWSVAYGGNYKDQLYFGFKGGIASANYRIERTYTENAINPGTDALQSMAVNDNLEINGVGFNMAFGLIYRPVDVIRFGLSLETPTYYSLRESYDGSLNANFNNFLFAEDVNDPANNFYLNNESSSLLPGNFDYNLRTPLRVNFGTSIFASKNGFISADVEYVDYSQSRISFQSPEGSAGADNRTISNLYNSAFNLRLGGEYRIDDFRIRGGYGNFGDPFKNNVNAVDQNRQRISGGFGMRLSDYYWDFAAVYDWWDEAYTPYTFEGGYTPSAVVSREITSFVLTGGFFF